MDKINKNTGNKKKMIKIVCGIAALIIALAIIAGIWAYYTAENSIINELTTAKYGNELVEKFTPAIKWQPGQEITKEVYVENTGDYDLFVRVSMSETWTFRDGSSKITIDSSDDPKFTAATAESVGANNGSVVYKNMNTENWEFSNGHWYFKTKLEASAYTSNLLESITLAGNTNMGDYQIVNYYTKADEKPANSAIGDNPNTQWVAYTSTLPVPEGATYTRSVSKVGNGTGSYADATYELTITSDIIQATKEAFDISGWNPPIILQSGWGIQFGY
jgi:alternate signal-mediated exported protein